MNNLNSTCLHTLRLSNILVKNRKRTHPSGWDDEDSEDEESEGEDLDSAEWQTRRSTQIHKEDEAFLALTAFVRRSIPFRAEQQGKTGEELAPAFCGCPNLISITWDGNDSLPHSDGSREPQSSNLMVLMTAIIGYVAQALIAMLDWEMDVQQAIAMPHLVNRFGTYDVEESTSAADLTTALADMGFEVNARGLTSGLHAISLGEALMGGADPRREGIALGQ